MKAFLIVGLALLTSGVFAQEFRERAVIEATINAVESLARADKTCETVADCTVLALGSRACGGPEKYLVVSKLNANFDLIQTLAGRSESLENAFNERYGVMSICSMALEKEAQCIAHLCM